MNGLSRALIDDERAGLALMTTMSEYVLSPFVSRGSYRNNYHVLKGDGLGYSY